MPSVQRKEAGRSPERDLSASRSFYRAAGPGRALLPLSPKGSTLGRPRATDEPRWPLAAVHAPPPTAAGTSSPGDTSQARRRPLRRPGARPAHPGAPRVRHEPHAEDPAPPPACPGPHAESRPAPPATPPLPVESRPSPAYRIELRIPKTLITALRALLISNPRSEPAKRTKSTRRVLRMNSGDPPFSCPTSVNDGAGILPGDMSSLREMALTALGSIRAPFLVSPGGVWCGSAKATCASV